MLFHTIQDITLQDTVNKKEYFIPRGKSYCDKLRRTVLHRIALEEERRENTDVVTELKMPYNDHSRSRNTTRDQKSTPKLVYVLAVIGIIACLVCNTGLSDWKNRLDGIGKQKGRNLSSTVVRNSKQSKK